MKLKFELFPRMGKVNRNGIMFPEEAVKEAVSKFKQKLPVSGTLNDKDVRYSNIINSVEVSHVVEDIEVLDGKVEVTVDVLDTEQGKVLKSMIENGSPWIGACSMVVMKPDEQQKTVERMEIVNTSFYID